MNLDDWWHQLDTHTKDRAYRLAVELVDDPRLAIEAVLGEAASLAHANVLRGSRRGRYGGASRQLLLSDAEAVHLGVLHAAVQLGPPLDVHNALRLYLADLAAACLPRSSRHALAVFAHHLGGLPQRAAVDVYRGMDVERRGGRPDEADLRRALRRVFARLLRDYSTLFSVDDRGRPVVHGTIKQAGDSVHHLLGWLRPPFAGDHLPAARDAYATWVAEVPAAERERWRAEAYGLPAAEQEDKMRHDRLERARLHVAMDQEVCLPRFVRLHSARDADELREWRLPVWRSPQEPAAPAAAAAPPAATAAPLPPWLVRAAVDGVVHRRSVESAAALRPGFEVLVDGETVTRLADAVGSRCTLPLDPDARGVEVWDGARAARLVFLPLMDPEDLPAAGWTTDAAVPGRRLELALRTAGGRGAEPRLELALRVARARMSLIRRIVSRGAQLGRLSRVVARRGRVVRGGRG